MNPLKTKTTSFVLSVLALFSYGSNAQESSLLWEVSGNGLAESSYLYGTVHMICPDDLNMSEPIMESLAKSEQLVMELDLDDPSLVMEMQRLSVNPGMRNISEDLTDEQLSTINAFFTKHYGTDMSQLGVMRPFSLLSMALVKGFECPLPASYEEQFLNYAEENEWETYGLESVEEQIAVIETASFEEQIEWLMAYIAEEDKLSEEMETMISLYLNEDLEGLAEYVENSPEMEGMADELLVKRNANWIDPMIEFASEQPTFFAVGAAHLGGATGVIKLLREAGYTVEPVR